MEEIKIIKENIDFKDLKFGDLVVEQVQFSKNSDKEQENEVYTVLYPGSVVITLMTENGRTFQLSGIFCKLSLVGHSDMSFYQAKQHQLTYEMEQLDEVIGQLEVRKEVLENERWQYEMLAQEKYYE